MQLDLGFGFILNLDYIIPDQNELNEAHFEESASQSLAIDFHY